MGRPSFASGLHNHLSIYRGGSPDATFAPLDVFIIALLCSNVKLRVGEVGGVLSVVWVSFASSLTRSVSLTNNIIIAHFMLNVKLRVC